MATDKFLPQIEVQTIVAEKEQTCDEKKDGFCLSTNSYNSDELHNTSPRTKLEKLSSQVYTKIRSKFKNNRCFLWSSKAVTLILVWNVIISIGFKSFLDPSLYTNIIAKYDFDHDYYDGYSSVLLIYGLSYGMNALLFLFYPLTGFLADVCWGRYTTVKNTLCFFF